MDNTNSYVEEIIKIMRPTNKNRIFNDTEYDVVTTTDTDGGKLVILRPKSISLNPLIGGTMPIVGNNITRNLTDNVDK